MGKIKNAEKAIKPAINYLIKMKCTKIILGCTELPIAIFASFGYVLMGLNNSLLPNMSLGYIYLPAVLGIAFTSIFTASYGAKIAHFVSENILKKLLISLMLVIAIYMIVL